MKPFSFVLDTNLFFNMEAESGLGKNSKEVMLSLYNYGLQLGSSYVQFYMPPAILDEVLTFLPETDENLKKATFCRADKEP
jgi:predicted DNA-binding protein (UPF0278 family)